MVSISVGREDRVQIGDSQAGQSIPNSRRAPAAVDEHRHTIGRDDQRRVSLPDIDEVNVEAGSRNGSRL